MSLLSFLVFYHRAGQWGGVCLASVIALHGGASSGFRIFDAAAAHITIYRFLSSFLLLLLLLLALSCLLLEQWEKALAHTRGVVLPRRFFFTADSKRNDRKRKLNPDVAAAAAAAAAASASGGTGFSSAGTAGAVAADSPSNRKLARSNSAAPTEGLQIGAEVAYRLPKKQNAEGEWIQCHVINILGDGNKRKCVPEEEEPVVVAEMVGEEDKQKEGTEAD